MTATLEPDPTDNPLDRWRPAVDPPAAHITAWDLADRLAGGTTPVIVRDHEIEHGYCYMDPCNLHLGEAVGVAERLAEELDRAEASNELAASSLAERRARRYRRLRSWPH